MKKLKSIMVAGIAMAVIVGLSERVSFAEHEGTGAQVGEQDSVEKCEAPATSPYGKRLAAKRAAAAAKKAASAKKANE